MATGYELIGRGLTDTTIRRRYHVEDVASDNDLVNFIQSLPSSVAGLPYASATADEVDEITGAFDVTVEYGLSNQGGGPTQDLETSEYRFNFQAPSAHIFKSLSTIATYAPAGKTAPDFKNMIGVLWDGEKYRVEGVNLSPPPEVFTLTYMTEVVTGTYQLLVEGLVGKVNSSTFRGRAAGSVMLARCSGGRTSENVWSIEFGFSYVANATSIPVGDITVASKDGMDLLWVLTENVEDAGAAMVVPNPLGAYVERVWERADLNLLGLPL